MQSQRERIDLAEENEPTEGQQAFSRKKSLSKGVFPSYERAI